MSEWINPIDTTNDTEVKGIPISNYANVKVGTSCLVCGEFIELNEWEARHTSFKLCPECIKAIKFAKTLMKNNPNMNVDGDIRIGHTDRWAVACFLAEIVRDGILHLVGNKFGMAEFF